jgi:hypothetical protein
MVSISALCSGRGFCPSRASLQHHLVRRAALPVRVSASLVVR